MRRVELVGSWSMGEWMNVRGHTVMVQKQRGGKRIRMDKGGARRGWIKGAGWALQRRSGRQAQASALAAPAARHGWIMVHCLLG